MDKQPKPIATKRGIRQSCPLNMLLFILGTEVLTQNSDPEITRLPLGKQTLKITQYADNVILFATESTSITKLVQIINTFSKHSDININPSKSKIMTNSKQLSSLLQSLYLNSQQVSQTKILDPWNHILL